MPFTVGMVVSFRVAPHSNLDYRVFRSDLSEGVMRSEFGEKIDGILSSGHSLSALGVNNWAFEREDALQVLEKLRESHVPVFGGDVYVLDRDAVRISHDNWYCEREVDETEIAYADRSNCVARTYVATYVSGLQTPLFSFVTGVDF